MLVYEVQIQEFRKKLLKSGFQLDTECMINFFLKYLGKFLTEFELFYEIKVYESTIKVLKSTIIVLKLK